MEARLKQGLDRHSKWVWLALVPAFAMPIFNGVVFAHLPFILPLFYPGDHSYFWNLWLSTFALQWVSSLGIIYCLKQSESGIEALGIPRPNWLVMSGLAVVAAVAAIAIIATASRPHPTGVAAMMFPWSPSERLLMLFVIAPTAPICEEIVYRGFFLAFFRSLFGVYLAVVLQAAIFSFQHGGFYQGPAFVTVLIVGVLFAVLRQWRGSLGAPMAVHFLGDAIIWPFLAQMVWH